ncbi:MAG: hypothetical protein GXP56_14865 [Deltaproteobacteria bacterium]|nr:hypothetical protein [Deltaproteobacteria bacterium]
MSDPILEEDSLISQDDIDKLLDSTSIEEAEENIANDDADVVDELGELSQDDIDQLMNSNLPDKEDPLDEDDSEDDEMELISQDDIDQLMNASSGGKVSSSGEDLDEDDLETISQDDINNLMGGGQAEDKESESEIPGDMEDNNEQDILPVEEEVVEKINETEIEKPAEPVLENKNQEDDYIIDESQAVEVQDSLISQDTIDNLIKNFDNEPASEPVILDEEPEPVPEPELEVKPEPESDVPEEKTPDDTEEFLKPESDVKVLDFEDEDGDVTQEDIDSLLLEPDNDEEDDDVLISQDDIDTLLMAADQEDEDVLGDLMDDEFDSTMDDAVDDEDILENENFDEYDEGDEDQVVLQGDDDEQSLKPVKKSSKVRSGWYKSKLVVACMSALIVLGIAVPSTYFIFFSGKPPGQEPRLATPVANLASDTQREIEVETVDINVKTQPDIKKPGTMLLKDFVILAPDLSKDMTYITADLSIDYSDQRAYHEILNNLSFYRDLIYDSINKGLASGKREDITEADILRIVETTLKKVLPGHYINRVSFKSFKAS